MELLMVFALCVVFAVLFNWGSPKFAATKFGTYFVGSYARVTLGTAIMVFITIYIASLLVSAANRGNAPALPSTSQPTA